MALEICLGSIASLNFAFPCIVLIHLSNFVNPVDVYNLFST